MGRRRTLAPEGIDPHYSDSYVPVGVEYLSYASYSGTDPEAGDRPAPEWRLLAE